LKANRPATVTTIKDTVGVCSTTDGYLGSLSSQVTSSIKKLVLTQNTYCGKDDGQGSARRFGYELPGTAPVGFPAAAKNNIVFCATNVACYLVHKGPTGTDSVGTYQGVDYNWKWNVQRHFLDWGQMLDPAVRQAPASAQWTPAPNAEKIPMVAGVRCRLSCSAFTMLRRRCPRRHRRIPRRDPAGSGRGRPGQDGGYCGRLPGGGDPLPESRSSPAPFANAHYLP
jgi:hypothetical protein